jgi:hypothetical protein
MSDSRNIVTGGFALTAIVLSIAAYLFYPKSADSGISSSVNKPLFDFESKDVRSLTITKFDSDKNESSALVLDRSLNFGWTVQSRQNYPVDSAERISKTSASLVGLVILDIASEDPNDEETYGVIEPADGIKVGQKGVGIKVTLQDRSKKELAAAIIGKAVKNNPALRFVRVPKQRIIYVCEFDPSILTTNLFAWINPRILSSGVGTQFDIDSIKMQNYAAASNGLIQVKKNYEFAASFNSNSWVTDTLVIGDGAKDSDFVIKANTLEPLREAITAFQITDVFKKSGGLAKTLSERKPIPNTFQIVEPIRKLGFFIDDKQTPIKVLSAGGQLSFTTSAGLAYQLWFGNLLPGTSGNPDQRYLMVSVDVDELKFPMPVKPGIGNASVNKPDESGAEKKNNGPPSPPKNGCEPNSIEPMVIEPTSRITQSQDDEREANRQYQIQLDTRNEKLAAQRKIADNINRRFADWFYLVDNAVYERVMPVQENVISTK